MRIVSVVLPVVLALLTLAGCVSRVGPAAAPPVSQLPSRSSVTGECDATDITATGALDEKPVVTLPTDCDPPTSLLAEDLVVGTGAQALEGADLEVNYVMIAWSNGVELDRTGYGTGGLPLSVADLGDSGWIHGWDEGLLGIREGGRRLFVVPPDQERGATANADTLVFVVDAVTVG
jgi:peptidylprolyl isomerase